MENVDGEKCGGYLLDGVAMSIAFSATLPVTLTPVLTTEPATEIAAPAVAPATSTTAQPETAAPSSSANVNGTRRRGGSGTSCGAFESASADGNGDLQTPIASISR